MTTYEIKLKERTLQFALAYIDSEGNTPAWNDIQGDKTYFVKKVAEPMAKLSLQIEAQVYIEMFLNPPPSAVTALNKEHAETALKFMGLVPSDFVLTAEDFKKHSKRHGLVR